MTRINAYLTRAALGFRARLQGEEGISALEYFIMMAIMLVIIAALFATLGAKVTTSVTNAINSIFNNV